MHVERRLFPMVTLALFLAATAFVSAVADDAPTYVGNTQCKMCHNKKSDGEVWNTWKALKHAKAYESLLGDEAKAIGEKQGLETPPAESPQCLRCHVTAYNVEEKSVPAKLKKEHGVQCESCHGPASLHLPDAKKFKTSKDPSINMAAHITRSDEKVCKKCHNETK